MKTIGQRIGLFAPLVELLRIVLLIKYLFFIAIGVTIWLVSSPSIDFTMGSVWTALWGIGIAVCAIGCSIGVLKDKWEPLERWAGAGLVILLAGYASVPISLVISGDLDRLLYSEIAAGLMIVPCVRVFVLLRWTGAKHER